MSAAEELFGNYAPHPKQQQAHEHARRFACANAGSRGGKTYWGAHEFLRRIYTDRQRRSGPLHYWALAPTYMLGDVQQEELFAAIGGVTSPYVRGWLKGERKLLLYNDITIEFKTASDPRKLVARGLNGFWLDEAARAKAECWQGGLRMRVTDRRGWGLFTTTPYGRNWYFAEIVDRSRHGSPGFSESLWFTADNTAIPDLAAEVAQAKTELPDPYFRREYEASFDAFVGQIYEEYSRAIHVAGVHPPLNPRETRYGVDWGFRNPGVILVLQKDFDGVWTVVEEVYETGIVVDGRGKRTWVEIAKGLVAKWGQGAFCCDPSSPERIDAFRRAGLFARKADNDLFSGIQTVAAALKIVNERPGLLICPCCSELVVELGAYRWDEASGGETPVKDRDHTCDALRYALHTEPFVPVSV